MPKAEAGPPVTVPRVLAVGSCLPVGHSYLGQCSFLWLLHHSAVLAPVFVCLGFLFVRWGSSSSNVLRETSLEANVSYFSPWIVGQT